MQSDSGHSAAHHSVCVCVSWPHLTTVHRYGPIRAISVKIRVRENVFVRNQTKQFVKKERKKKRKKAKKKKKRRKKEKENQENPRINAVKISVCLFINFGRKDWLYSESPNLVPQWTARQSFIGPFLWLSF